MIDQENVSNNKIDILMREKYNLDTVLKQFTKSNTILESMIYNSKLSSNKEGLGYDANIPLEREAHISTPTQDTQPKTPTNVCSICNSSGHESLNCNAKEGVNKGKCKWIPKGAFLNKIKEKKIAQGN
ncbi:hypothetical protein POM88_041172 [Heracleum sosnowskyi]|uniref:Uncharacterized protein n=1 Tax=Heracleum sosnowskyi TaxID=360622 RepID=A0AAD8M9G8_9APIA|nr:hypothetical protein POM88_041172 [Heracleum sosnowskyi]